ncbi:MAG: NAD(P)H-dependent oxidoreductase [Pseudobacteriovorax sp.]|nr:NAD(P)H-dependent oxidoreductase [Pseudobacteriovorax sp.]
MNGPDVIRVLAISGSLAPESANEKLLRAINKLATDDLAFTLVDIIGSLPFFQPERAEINTPASVDRWRTLIQAHDVVVFASPEYGHSMPGVLKNAIDWLIPSGELTEKAVAITSAVKHDNRGKMGLKSLEMVLNACEAAVIWNEAITNQNSRQILRMIKSLLNYEKEALTI